MNLKTEEICCQFTWKGANWTLHPKRGIYWKEQRMLLVADSHFGKIKHFQQAGIPLPDSKEQNTYGRLENMIAFFQPEKVVFLGDLFHSVYNTAWEQFVDWREKYAGINFHLVRGNHDILEEAHYQKLDIQLHDQGWQIGPFLLTHDPLNPASELISIGGHLHPGLVLTGKGKQRVKLPCFYFDETKCILPALGYFTGLANIEINKNASLFVTTDKQVLKI